MGAGGAIASNNFWIICQYLPANQVIILHIELHMKLNNKIMTADIRSVIARFCPRQLLHSQSIICVLELQVHATAPNCSYSSTALLLESPL